MHLPLKNECGCQYARMRPWEGIQGRRNLLIKEPTGGSGGCLLLCFGGTKAPNEGEDVQRKKWLEASVGGDRVFLKEEVALAGYRLKYRCDNVKVEKKSRTIRYISTKIEIYVSERCEQSAQVDTVDRSVGRYYRKTVLSRVSVDLVHRGCVAPEDKTTDGCVCLIDEFESLCYTLILFP